MDKINIEELILNYIKEDVGDGDHTSLACIPKETVGKVKLIVKENGIIAGIGVSKTIFSLIDKNIKIVYHKHDGETINKDDIVFEAEGNSISLLLAERLVLNCMQRMSGIATETKKYSEVIKHTKAKILDTRKTTPGFRIFEKMAVKIGGGENHRMGLYDMIMIKDNHVDFSGGIENAINATNKYLKENKKDLKIIIEARSLEEVKSILNTGNVDRIMLDNFSITNTIKAVSLINNKYEVESSGNITLNNLLDYAECGVDYISIGALTHHIKSLDLSLKAV